ncbi:MAG: hypothetical protein ACFCU4_02515 [Puniceicoccaceae bacterium]
MRNRLLLLATCVVAAISLSACKAPSSSEQAALIKPREGFNFLGLVKFEEGAYAQKTPTSFGVESDDLMLRENYSGNHLSLLWGLVQFNDY